MQFGIFSVGDVTADPTNGSVPSEAERIRAMVAIAEATEQAGLDAVSYTHLDVYKRQVTGQ